MILTDDDIRKLTKVRRLNLINSVTGIKPANLIGTVANDGRTNLAIFSSVVHLGSNPALVGFVMRPTSGEPRHTYENIKANGFYTINHVRESFVEKAHYTSAKFPREMSEFAVCRLTEEYVEGFKAPFVKESRVKFGLKFEQEIPIELNGTIFMIGSVRPTRAR
jgi:flavin reductase (DIM6/NTAB) family NADH-FMN oxidoreductase RutF